MVWWARHAASIVQDAECGPAPAPGGGSRAQSWGAAGWGRTGAGPACSGGVGVPGGQAAAGVGALQVDALGGRGAVMLGFVGTLVPICRWERHRTGGGQEKARGCSENGRRQSGAGNDSPKDEARNGWRAPGGSTRVQPSALPGSRTQPAQRPPAPALPAGWLAGFGQSLGSTGSFGRSQHPPA